MLQEKNVWDVNLCIIQHQNVLYIKVGYQAQVVKSVIKVCIRQNHVNFMLMLSKSNTLYKLHVYSTISLDKIETFQKQKMKDSNDFIQLLNGVHSKKLLNNVWLQCYTNDVWFSVVNKISLLSSTLTSGINWLLLGCAAACKEKIFWKIFHEYWALLWQ